VGFGWQTNTGGGHRGERRWNENTTIVGEKQRSKGGKKKGSGGRGKKKKRVNPVSIFLACCRCYSKRAKRKEEKKEGNACIRRGKTNRGEIKKRRIHKNNTKKKRDGRVFNFLVSVKASGRGGGKKRAQRGGKYRRQ